MKLENRQDATEIYKYECGGTVFSVYPRYKAQGQAVSEILQTLMMDNSTEN